MLISSFRIFVRQISTFKNELNAQIVRNQFIDFFSEHDHNFVRSSSVIPFHDPTIPFINAGMCQFKHILTDEIKPPHKRIVNSQKCIRVSGKHNDLDEVGFDGSHHTFFEMLGNWSFNDYYKETACTLAWRLLTSPPFSLDKNKLYVSYFNGDSSLSLPADIETYDVWRKIGVDHNHILPMGLADNFWEMGRIGPCGPCTEILIDRSNGSKKINLASELTELWNIVFIQYNRDESGSLNTLSHSHIDTGMGLERILAVLLNKNSNYDTDLFLPLFETTCKMANIKKYEGKFGTADFDGIDTAYRILADHCRMITVAMADGIFPDMNVKLRRVLRKALSIPEQNFNLKSGTELVLELTKKVADSLASTYPEIGNNLSKVLTLIQCEAEVFEALRKASSKNWSQLLLKHPELASVDVNSMLGIVKAYDDTKKQMEKRNLKKGDFLPPDLMLRLYDTFGLDLEATEDLGRVLGFSINKDEFNNEFDCFKKRSAEGTLMSILSTKQLSEKTLLSLQKFCRKTDDSFKYKYSRIESLNSLYKFEPLRTKLLAVIKNDKIIFGADFSQRNSSTYESLMSGDLTFSDNDELLFIFEKTCFYSEAGGQQSDLGYFLLQSIDGREAKIEVNNVKNISGYVIHHGKVRIASEPKDPFTVKPEYNVSLFLNESHRIGSMRAHTTVHILNALLRQTNKIFAQRASSVETDSFSFDFSVYGSKFNVVDIPIIEEKFKQIIKSACPVSRSIVPGAEMFTENIVFLPGEVYPYESIMVIEMKDNNFFSKEACCGTHVFNTEDIKDFCITKYKANNRIHSISGVTGDKASTIAQNASRVVSKMNMYKTEIESSVTVPNIDAMNSIEKKIKDLEHELKSSNFPFSVHSSVQEFITLKLKKKLKHVKRYWFMNECTEEIVSLLNSQKSSKFIVHYLSKQLPNDKISMPNVLENVNPSLPVLIFSYIDGFLEAECWVPQTFVTKEFSAEIWMKIVAEILNTNGYSLQNENPQLRYHLRKKVQYSEVPSLVKILLDESAQKAVVTVA